MRGLLLEPVLADVEALNERALRAAEPLPVTKLSLPALARVAADYAVLPSGGALGFGCGPLVVVRADSRLGTLGDLAEATLAIPGRQTTAFLLASSLAPAAREVVPLRFHEVMPAVAAGRCEIGGGWLGWQYTRGRRAPSWASRAGTVLAVEPGRRSRRVIIQNISSAVAIVSV